MWSDLLDNEFIVPMNMYMGDDSVVLSKQYVLWLQQQLDIISEAAQYLDLYLDHRKDLLRWEELTHIRDDKNINEAIYKVKKILDNADYRGNVNG